MLKLIMVIILISLRHIADVALFAAAIFFLVNLIVVSFDLSWILNITQACVCGLVAYTIDKWLRNLIKSHKSF